MKISPECIQMHSPEKNKLCGKWRQLGRTSACCSHSNSQIQLLKLYSQYAVLAKFSPSKWQRATLVMSYLKFLK